MRTLMLAAIAFGASAAAASASAQGISDIRAPAPRIALQQLAGTWSFAVYQSAGEAPVATGRREMRLLADSLKLAWTESYDGRPATSDGFLGYDERAGTYYLLGVQSGDPAPMFLVGRAEEGAIRFDPAKSPAGIGNRPGVFVASDVRVVDRAHFEWTAVDGRWRVEFTRVGDR
jgi:hypothetical protein